MRAILCHPKRRTASLRRHATPRKRSSSNRNLPPDTLPVLRGVVLPSPDVAPSLRVFEHTLPDVWQPLPDAGQALLDIEPSLPDIGQRPLGVGR